MSDELCYGIIKYNKKEKPFIVIDRNRTMMYDSRVGFLDLKALSLKDKIESDEIYKLIAYMKSLMISGTDRNTISTDNNQFYFKILQQFLESKSIKIQNDVSTKEMVKDDGLKTVWDIFGIIVTCFRISNNMSTDSTAKTAALVAASTKIILNKTNTLVNFGYGYGDVEPLHEHYIDEETIVLNKKEQADLVNLCDNKEKFRDEIIYFVRDKTL